MRSRSEIVAGAPLADEVGGGFRPIGKLKLESGLKQAAGNDAAALEDQLRLAAQKKCADRDERRGRRQAVGHVPGLAQRGHELAVRQRMGRGEIDGAVDLFMVDEEFEGAGEVGFVNPGNILAAVALRSAEAEADQTREHGEDAAGLGAENERGAKRDLARARRFDRRRMQPPNL